MCLNDFFSSIKYHCQPFITWLIDNTDFTNEQSIFFKRQKKKNFNLIYKMKLLWRLDRAETRCDLLDTGLPGLFGLFDQWYYWCFKSNWQILSSTISYIILVNKVRSVLPLRLTIRFIVCIISSLNNFYCKLFSLKAQLMLYFKSK